MAAAEGFCGWGCHREFDGCIAEPCKSLSGGAQPRPPRHAAAALQRATNASRADGWKTARFAGGSLWPPPARDGTLRALGGPLAGAAPRRRLGVWQHRRAEKRGTETPPPRKKN